MAEPGPGQDSPTGAEPDEVDEVPVLPVEMLPEVVADLASASEQHTRQLADLGGAVSELGGLASTTADDVAVLREIVQELHLTLAERADLTGPSRWAWEFLSREEAAQLWAETRWFVDYLSLRYPLSTELSIPPCWYRHTVAVDELSDLYAAWREAYCSGDRPSDAMTGWRNRWFWPTLHTLSSHADWRECKAQREHVEPTARQEPTDSQFDDFVARDLAQRPRRPPMDLPWPTRRSQGEGRGHSAP